MKEFIRTAWGERDYEGLMSHLKTLAEEEYRDFCLRLTPTSLPMLGVRLPILKQVAREIAKGAFLEYLSWAQDRFYEEVLLQGLVIGAAKTDIEEVLSLTENLSLIHI